MNPVRIAAIVLIFVGVLWMADGTINYTAKPPETKQGAIEFAVMDEQAVKVIVWAGKVPSPLKRSDLLHSLQIRY